MKTKKQIQERLREINAQLQNLNRKLTQFEVQRLKHFRRAYEWALNEEQEVE